MTPSAHLTKITKRLQKLLALAASPNVAEAASAMNKAQELMEKYNIRTVDVDIETNTANVSHTVIPGYSRVRSMWQSELGASIAKCFDGTALNVRCTNGPWLTTFIASNTEIEIIKDLYLNLRRTIGRMAKVYSESRAGDPRTIRNAYAHGIVEVVYWRLKEVYKKMKPEDMALVLCKQESIDKLAASLFNEIKDEKPNKNVCDTEAYYQGLKDGKNVDLSQTPKDKYLGRNTWQKVT